MAKPRLSEVNFGSWKWINITHPTELETVQLKHLYNFNDLDLKAVLPPIQRPRLDSRDGYLFMILLYPLYDRSTRKIHAVEVDFFIGKNFLITALSEDFPPLSEYFNHFKKNKKDLTTNSVPELLFQILTRLDQYCLPMSVHLSNDIDHIENEVFGATDKQKTINEVLLIKTNIVNFRKALNRHARILQNLSNRMGQQFPSFPDELFKELIEETDDLWGMLENYQDTINAIHESHLSLLNYRSNVTMQLFTVFTTVIFTLELMVALVSLGLTINNNWMNLGIVFSSLIIVGVIMVIFFKRRRWI